MGFVGDSDEKTNGVANTFLDNISRDVILGILEFHRNIRTDVRPGRNLQHKNIYFALLRLRIRDVCGCFCDKHSGIKG
jgi:hypothetical protein